MPKKRAPGKHYIYRTVPEQGHSFLVNAGPLLARRPRRAYTCVKHTFLHLSDMLLASVTIILKPIRYYGSRFTWSACSLSIRISNNSSICVSLKTVIFSLFKLYQRLIIIRTVKVLIQIAVKYSNRMTYFLLSNNTSVWSQ